MGHIVKKITNGCQTLISPKRWLLATIKKNQQRGGTRKVKRKKKKKQSGEHRVSAARPYSVRTQ